MVDVWLPYGETEVCARIPTENLQDIIEINDRAGVENPVDEIQRSIKNPIDSKTLAEIVKPGDKVALALSVPDTHLSKLIVSIVIGEITQSGLKSDDLNVILTRDPFNPKSAELATHVGSELAALGVNVTIHDSISQNTYVADTESGIKVHLNKIFTESKVRVAAGIVEPNPYTMYSWSGYGVALGLSDVKTLEGILAPTLSIEDPAELTCKNIIDISRVAGVDFSINIIANMKRNIVGSCAGNLEKTFYESIKIADVLYKVSIEKRPDIVLASPGGSPYDANLFSALKCLDNALKIVKRNGVIILVAECLEGYGLPELYEVISRFKDDLSSLERSLRKKFSVGGFVAYRFLRAFRKASILMVSALPDYYVSEIPELKIFRTANEAVKFALEKSGRKSRISAIPHGNFIIPEMKEAEITFKEK